MTRMTCFISLTLGFLASSAALAQNCAGMTVQHALGTTCVPKTPKRVVALEWVYTEDLLALGVQPVGVADIKGYESWVRIPVKLGAGVKDVGGREQPSFEKIMELKPDLIVVPKFRATQTYGRLSAIAPTLAFDSYPTDGSSQYQQMRQTFTTLARVLGRAQQGRDVLARLDKRLAQGKAQLARAGRQNQSFVLTQAFTTDNQPTMRLFGKNALTSQVLEGLGLRNAWTQQTDLYGFSTVSLEVLPTLRTQNFFYITQDNDNVFGAPSVTPLWNRLSFVQAKQAYRLAGDTWTFGGPLSAMTLIDQVLNRMLPR
ncbi:iron complex transport system substrate-binding protein [Deinobacterium chartae]|uniref:Iron complex transport system substrate-binding protein n=1 Tax=Deinobacterium chartae TaxID=521158 RepID=A0A841I3F1_9DEIO|nr:iron-siderophore ABC transporter substrate-binding protein [Deinobacterium chartae]MBB6098898.1 iron complex transport system substrate-binding protein [Deinobacterium chartae]